MAPKLYSTQYSPAVRSVLLTAKAIGLELETKTVDLGKKEHLSEDFLEKNPQHTVPVLEEEDGFILWDSHAIMPYIIEKYASDDQYYPNDPRKRAIIHQRLHFDTLSSVVRGDAIKPLFHAGASSIPEQLVEKIKEHYDLLETLLKRSKWIAGDSVTIADFSLIPSITTADIIAPIDENTHPQLFNWMKNCENWKFYEENRRGHEALKTLILEKLQK